MIEFVCMIQYWANYMKTYNCKLTLFIHVSSKTVYKYLYLTGLHKVTDRWCGLAEILSTETICSNILVVKVYKNVVSLKMFGTCFDMKFVNTLKVKTTSLALIDWLGNYYLASLDCFVIGKRLCAETGLRQFLP